MCKSVVARFFTTRFVILGVCNDGVRAGTFFFFFLFFFFFWHRHAALVFTSSSGDEIEKP